MLSSTRELYIPEGKVLRIYENGSCIWSAGSADKTRLLAPIISLFESTLTIDSIDANATAYAILVDGVRLDTVSILKPTEGLAYNLSADGTYYISAGLGTATATEIVIASEINGIPVTTIGRLAFNTSGQGASFTSIVIPKSVTLMKEACLYNCKKLTDIYYTGTVSEFQSITKERIWAKWVPATYVTCTDGIVEITAEEKGET